MPANCHTLSINVAAPATSVKPKFCRSLSCLADKLRRARELAEATTISLESPSSSGAKRAAFSLTLETSCKRYRAVPALEAEDWKGRAKHAEASVNALQEELSELKSRLNNDPTAGLTSTAITKIHEPFADWSQKTLEVLTAIVVIDHKSAERVHKRLQKDTKVAMGKFRNAMEEKDEAAQLARDVIDINGNMVEGDKSPRDFKFTPER